MERCLSNLIQGIGDYLTRVVGSVPIDLKITAWIHDARTSVYPRVASQVGPLYYEGQGPMSVRGVRDRPWQPYLASFL